jgi:hypothetical protein
MPMQRAELITLINKSSSLNLTYKLDALAYKDCLQAIDQYMQFLPQASVVDNDLAGMIDEMKQHVIQRSLATIDDLYKLLNASQLVTNTLKAIGSSGSYVHKSFPSTRYYSAPKKDVAIERYFEVKETINTMLMEQRAFIGEYLRNNSKKDLAPHEQEFLNELRSKVDGTKPDRLFSWVEELSVTSRGLRTELSALLAYENPNLIELISKSYPGSSLIDYFVLNKSLEQQISESKQTRQAALDELKQLVLEEQYAGALNKLKEFKDNYQLSPEVDKEIKSIEEKLTYTQLLDRQQETTPRERLIAFFKNHPNLNLKDPKDLQTYRAALVYKNDYEKTLPIGDGNKDEELNGALKELKETAIISISQELMTYLTTHRDLNLINPDDAKWHATGVAEIRKIQQLFDGEIGDELTKRIDVWKKGNDSATYISYCEEARKYDGLSNLFNALYGNKTRTFKLIDKGKDNDAEGLLVMFNEFKSSGEDELCYTRIKFEANRLSRGYFKPNTGINELKIVQLITKERRELLYLLEEKLYKENETACQTLQSALESLLTPEAMTKINQGRKDYKYFTIVDYMNETDRLEQILNEVKVDCKRLIDDMMVDIKRINPLYFDFNGQCLVISTLHYQEYFKNKAKFEEQYKVTGKLSDEFASIETASLEKMKNIIGFLCQNLSPYRDYLSDNSTFKDLMDIKMLSDKAETGKDMAAIMDKFGIIRSSLEKRIKIFNDDVKDIEKQLQSDNHFQVPSSIEEWKADVSKEFPESYKSIVDHFDFDNKFTARAKASVAPIEEELALYVEMSQELVQLFVELKDEQEDEPEQVCFSLKENGVNPSYEDFGPIIDSNYEISDLFQRLREVESHRKDILTDLHYDYLVLSALWNNYEVTVKDSLIDLHKVMGAYKQLKEQPEGDKSPKKLLMDAINQVGKKVTSVSLDASSTAAVAQVNEEPVVADQVVSVAAQESVSVDLTNPLILNNDENSINLNDIPSNKDNNSANVILDRFNICSESPIINQIPSKENEGISEGVPHEPVVESGNPVAAAKSSLAAARANAIGGISAIPDTRKMKELMNKSCNATRTGWSLSGSRDVKVKSMEQIINRGNDNKYTFKDVREFVLQASFDRSSGKHKATTSACKLFMAGLAKTESSDKNRLIKSLTLIIAMESAIDHLSTYRGGAGSEKGKELSRLKDNMTVLFDSTGNIPDDNADLKLFTELTKVNRGFGILTPSSQKAFEQAKQQLDGLKNGGEDNEGTSENTYSA